MFTGEGKGSHLILFWFNATFEDSINPAMEAVESQNLQMTDLQLDNGAKVNATTAKGCLAPLDFSCHAGSPRRTLSLVDREANSKALPTNDLPDTPASSEAKFGTRSQPAVNYVVSINPGRFPADVTFAAMYR